MTEQTTPMYDEQSDAPAPRARAFTWRVARSARGRGRLRVGLVIVALFYAVAVFADFLAPYEYGATVRREPYAPPTVLRFRDAGGRFHPRPFIYARRLTDPLARTYAEDVSRTYPLALFTRGYTYKLFGLVKTDLHLFGVRGEAGGAGTPRVNLLGTDALGRDRFSRLVAATRFSLFVGPVGTLLAGLLGVLVGCLAGYAGRAADTVLMRAADAMMALPELVLILAARAAFPLVLSPASAAALLVVIFTAVGWAEVARLTRGLVLSLRRREFVLAAVSLGLSETRILLRHILPNAARPLVVQLSLMLPAFLLAETALSYLGVGVQEPAASWGNMLTAASDLTLLGRQPLTLLAPAFAIFLFVLGARLVSDGLRQSGEGRP